ncbi:MAG: type II secretion system F family protein [Acidobacteriota bacterium]
MPEFVCKLGTATGDVVERTYSGDSEKTLRETLAEQDFLVLSIRRKLGLSLPFLGQHRRIPTTDFLVFNQELAALIKAGLPILSILDMLIERRKHPTFKQALIEIRDQVRSGVSLSEAFAAQGDLFPSLYAPSLASGERSGEIATVLQRYIEYSESIAAIRKKLISASVYPAILVSVMIIVIYIMMGHVFPQFTDFFSTMQADLPLSTVILLGVSNWVSRNNLFILVGGVVLVGGFVAFRRTETGRELLDRFKLQVPIMGPIFKKYSTTRFSRTLGTLLSGGIPLVMALQIASRTVDNRVFAESLKTVGRKVREGGALWEALEETGFLTDMAVEMVRVGESTGGLTAMLQNVSEFYESEIESRIQTLLSLLEPVMLVFMAVVVGGLLLAIYMPLLSSFSSANF